MIVYFADHELDYISFVYGIAFMLLAAVCSIIRNESPVRLPWVWLGLFGLAHGSSEWLDMTTLIRGSESTLSGLRLGVMTLSFIFLVEFGRDGTLRVTGRGPGRWIYLPLLACVGVGGFAGMSGTNAIARYALGLVGGVWSSFVLFRAAGPKRGEGRLLVVAAAAMTGYAVAAGAIVPPCPWFPASVLNQTSFQVFTGFPVQMLRGALAFLIAVTIWGYYLQVRISALPDYVGVRDRNNALRTAMMLVVTLAMGWILTRYAGSYANHDVQKDLLDQTRTAAAALNPDKIRSLAGNRVDVNDANYLGLQERLMRVRTSNPLIVRSYLVFLRNGKLTSVVDGDAWGQSGLADRDSSDEKAPNVLSNIFISGRDATVGPWVDNGELRLSAFAVIPDSLSGRTLAVFGLDVNTSRWKQIIARARMVSIGATLMISMILIGFTIARQRLWELAQRATASERRLIEAQAVAHVGSWTYDLRSNRFAWSEEMFRVYGVAPGEAVPSFDEQLELLHPEDRPRLKKILERAIRERQGYESEFRVVQPDGTIRCIVAKGEVRQERNGEIVQLFGTAQDITERKQAEEQRERIVCELEGALAKVRVLSGLLPICAWCKRVRDDEGYWKQIESYIEAHSDAEFTHGICPDCAETHRKRTRKLQGVAMLK